MLAADFVFLENHIHSRVFWQTLQLEGSFLGYDLSLVYMVGYVGVNLFTMGKVLNNPLGWETFWGAVLVAVVSVSYVSRGGRRV